MDIAKSLSFVEQKGTTVEKARVNTIAYGLKPEPEVIQYFLELQNEDGGFPYGMEKHNPGSISDTLLALSWFDDLGMVRAPPATKAAHYLRKNQKDDGGWDENPAIATFDLPPWSIPGDLKARLYLTANSAFWLAVMGYKTDPGFQQTLDFLLNHQNETGKFFGFLHTTWIATAVFFLAGDRYAQVANKSIQFLSTRPLDQWADSQIGWALSYFAKAGLDKDHPFIKNGLAELLKRQKPDGSWSSEDGETFDVGTTIEAVKVLKHYGLIPKSI